ncbi:MAG TPA: DUF6701 domain-containing protein [Burkholderiales bacterium]|nr:DUF6701 domain-containing protein [Burkholderiales bacterium]
MGRVFLLVVGLALGLGAQAQVAFRDAASASVDGGVSYVASGTASVSGNCATVVAPSTPGGTAGDLLIALYSSSDASSATPSAGWNTLLASNPVADHSARIFWRLADGSGSDNLSVARAGTCNVAIGQIARFHNVDAANPFDSGQPIAAGNCTAGGTRVKCSYQNSGTVTSGEETSVTATAMSLFAVFIRDNNATGLPANFSEAFDSGSGTGINVQISLKYRQETAAGTISAVSIAKAGGSDPNHGVLFALRPAPSSALTIATPAATLSGDVMVAAVAVQPSDVAITPPAGWTAQTPTVQSAANPSRQQIFVRAATASEPASHTWTFGSGHTGAVGGIVSYLGADNTVLDAFSGNTTPVGGDTTLQNRAQSVDTSVANAMVVSTHSLASSRTWTPAAGMTERVDVASRTPNNADGISLEIADVAQAAAGATGDKVATVGGNGDSGTAQLLALRPAPINFDVQAGDYNLSCAAFPAEVAIIARDASGGVLTGYTGLVNLSTSTGTGDWSVGTAAGTLVNGTANDGAATYQFVAADMGRIVLRLAVTAASSVTVTVQDASTSYSSIGTAINFISNAYVIVPDGVQVAGRAQTITVQYRTAPGCGLSTANGHGANNAEKVWLTLAANHPGAAALPGATGVTAVNPLPAAEPGANNITLAFAGGEATFQLTSSDVGKYRINVRDTNSARRGSSPWITTRPFALAMPGAAHGTSDTSALLAAAGDDFSLTVGAYLWQVADDGDNDGVPDAGANVTDNGLAPAFAWDTVLSAGAILPAGGTAGTLTLGGATPTVPAASFAGGAAAPSNVRYSEVGNVFIAANASAFLDTPGANVTGDSGLDGSGAAGGYVGRFRPKKFAASAASLTNRLAASCSPASAFSYMDEGFRLAFTLTAQSAQGATTQNYNGVYAKLALGSFAAFGFGAKSGAADLSARLDNGLAPTGSWANGAANVTVTTAIERAVPDNPDGPYANLRIGIAPSDADGVQMDTLDLDVDGNSTPEHKDLGVSTEVRFGRLRLQNVIGSERLALDVPVSVQYWTGSGFATNTLDSCTTLGRDNIALAFNAASNLTSCETALSAATIAFASGAGSLHFAAPGPSNNGSVVLAPQLGNSATGSYCPSVGAAALAATPAFRGYLLGRWNDAADADGDPATAYDDDPPARAAFGVYGAQPKTFIFYREVY